MRSCIKQEKILMALEHGLQNIRSSRIDIYSLYSEHREPVTPLKGISAWAKEEIVLGYSIAFTPPLILPN